MPNPYETPAKLDDEGRIFLKKSTLLELGVVATIIVILLAVLLPAMQQPRVYTFRSAVAASMRQIELVISNVKHESGFVPTKVSDLHRLIELGNIECSTDPNDYMGQMLITGKDYWGSPLQMHPVNNKPGFIELRCLGPDRIYDVGASSDDIFIQYEMQSDSSEQR